MPPDRPRPEALGGRLGYAPCRGISAARSGGARVAVRIMLHRVLASAKNHRVRSFRWLNAEVVLMGVADVRAAAGRVLAALRGAGRSEGTIRRHQVVLDRFAAFLAGRGLNSASDQEAYAKSR